MTYKKLGDYIQKVEQFGAHNLTVQDVRGVSIK
jgi:hypothetical protein